MAKKPPTRSDVARLAKVSVASVSYAFDERNGKVSPATRARILEIAEELGYRPNRIAGGLRRGRTDLVGMMVPDITNPFFSELARAVEGECYRRDLMLLLASVDNDPEREEEYVRSLTDMQVTGVIVTSTNVAGISQAAQKTLFSSGIPYIRLDRNGGSTQNLIAVDNRLGAYMAVTHLIRHGYRSLLCIAGPCGLDSADQRVQGCADASGSAKGVEVKTLRGEFSFESGYRLMYAALKQSEEPPDAVFASSDVQALGALHAILETGHRVPDDVAVIGFDGARESRYSCPPLSTVKQPIAQLAAKAVESLLAQSDGKSGFEHPMLLSPKLVRRSSCGCVWDEMEEVGLL
uniref:LacI family DNA-binding transcriptional regulator n=1 Tax=Vaginimicrobium propionicum TaxID=1871034 RepID=UPI0009F8DEC8|nr:LacI family DNA-binding transcriptional regulator [Vaginimicrobium propionicum]